MNYEASSLAVIVFLVLITSVLGLSFWLGRLAKSSSGYFAAHGQIHWFVNGFAFAGDYLSAASFLGICGMIAFYGYDGFLYSIGFLAGWVVALFLIGEPMRRLGKFTFADAVDSKFRSKQVKFAAALSTLFISVFYLIPQMVGAGALSSPLLGISKTQGIILVGGIVMFIVATAGMVSTTWVQFIKGAMLVLFCSWLVMAILQRGTSPADWASKKPIKYASSFEGKLVGDEIIRNYYDEAKPAAAGGSRPVALVTKSSTKRNPTLASKDLFELSPKDLGLVKPRELPEGEVTKAMNTSRLESPTSSNFRGMEGGWQVPRLPTIEQPSSDDKPMVWKLINRNPLGPYQGFVECQTVVRNPDGTVKSINGDPKGQLLPFAVSLTGFEPPLGPLGFLNTFSSASATVSLLRNDVVKHPDGSTTTAYYLVPQPGNDIMMPGMSPTYAGLKKNELMARLDFISLMLALFCGTAALPHILIRYYTVKDADAARKSTVVGITVIGFFYCLTLFIGLAAMISNAIDPSDSNMSAPLLTKTFGDWPFAVVSAISFTTVLGTVSGLILAASGALVHDLLCNVMDIRMEDSRKVLYARISSCLVCILAMFLGVQFQKMNVSFLVGWAFNIAASANLPALLMILFWPRTTKSGIVASILVGLFGSLSWILLSAQAYKDVFGLDPAKSLMPFSQPAIVTFPLSIAVLIIVSLMTKPTSEAK